MTWVEWVAFGAGVAVGWVLTVLFGPYEEPVGYVPVWTTSRPRP